MKAGDRVIAGDDRAQRQPGARRTQGAVSAISGTGGHQERLKTELAAASSLTMPEDLKASGIEYPDVTGIWNGQIYQFESRAAAFGGQRKVIKEKIAQL
jgi:hypothetical protein